MSGYPATGARGAPCVHKKRSNNAPRRCILRCSSSPRLYWSSPSLLLVSIKSNTSSPIKHLGGWLSVVLFSGSSLAHTWTMVALCVQHGMASWNRIWEDLQPAFLSPWLAVLTMLLPAILLIPGERSLCAVVACCMVLYIPLNSSVVVITLLVFTLQ
jgi:hypothetical protein